MAVAFTGTKTGNAYVAGKVYSNGNGSYRANLDGSFTRLSNGGSVVGSSQSASAAFSTTSGKFLGFGQAGREAAVAYVLGGGGGAGVPRVSAGGSGKSLAGPGKAGVLANAVSPNTSGPGVPAVVARPASGGFLGGGFLDMRRDAVMGVPKKVTRVYINGVEIPRNPKTSDIGDLEDAYGEAEFPSIQWVLAQGMMIDNLWDKHPYKPAVDGWVANERARIARDKAAQAADDKRVRDNMDAWHSDFSETYGYATSGWANGYTTGGGF